MKTYDEISASANEAGEYTHGKTPTEARVHYRVGFIDGAKWMQEQDKWTPVTERLPELNTPCLSYSPLMKRATIDQYREYPSGKVSFAFRDVTHWQPLPGAPSSALQESQSASE